MMRELPGSWSDMDVDPTLRLLAERAARIAGIPVDAWLERAIRRACAEYFVPQQPVVRPAPAAYVEPPRPMAPPPQPMPAPTRSGAGAALAELIARARQSQPEPQAFVPPAPAAYVEPPRPMAPQPPPMPRPVMPPPPATNIAFEAPELPAPTFDVSGPVSRAHDEPVPSQHDEFAARQPSPLERARESKRRAAAFATEVADWRGHDERPPRFGAPWPTFDDGSAEEPYVPLDAGAGFDTREPLELRNPIRARRSRRPLVIAVGIALAVALGALGAQRFIVGRLGHSTSTENADITAPPIGQSTELQQHAALSSPARLPAPMPAAPSAAMPSSPPVAAPQTATNDTGALLPPSLVTPTSNLPPPPPVAMSTPVTPLSALPPPSATVESLSPVASSVPSQPSAAPSPPAQPAVTASARPDMPPPLPSRKVAAAAPTATQTAEAAATAAARQAAAAEVPKDPARLANWLEQRAKTGDAVAEYRLGVLYALGQGVKQDYGRAAQLFKSAANGGVAEAQYNVAVMYSEGMGVQRDPVQAVTWYKKAAEQGNANAAFNLGVAYSNGTGVKQDMPEAARWFRRSAAAGVINAQFNLGLLYERGEGVPQSLVEAYAWYAAAASRGDQGAAQRRDHLAGAMAPADIKKAQARATQLQQTIQTSTAPIASQKANTATH
ncbi:MAG TPA: tetratricopeptide repeat protein [Stellaceae bacterium]|nr:tetratricopeptide repeat protein [Stellaceae bacterium]